MYVMIYSIIILLEQEFLFHLQFHSQSQNDTKIGKSLCKLWMHYNISGHTTAAVYSIVRSQDKAELLPVGSWMLSQLKCQMLHCQESAVSVQTAVRPADRQHSPQSPTTNTSTSWSTDIICCQTITDSCYQHRLLNQGNWTVKLIVQQASDKVLVNLCNSQSLNYSW